MAMVTGIDTMTVLDSVDTVKKIILTSYHGTNINAIDSLNGFEILITKNHGFLQIFDLYTFPYHMPDTAYYQGLDYYLDKSINVCPFYPIGAVSQSDYVPSKKNAIYKIKKFVNPAYNMLYDWQPGDIFEYTYKSPAAADYSLIDPYQYIVDTVVTKQINTGSTEYSFVGSISQIN